MRITSGDLDFLSKKINLSPEKTFILTEQDRDLSLILEKLTDKADSTDSGIEDISMPLFLRLTIFKYTKNFNVKVEEKSYVADSIAKNFPLQIKHAQINDTKRHTEENAQYNLVLLGLFKEYIEKSRNRKATPSTDFYFKLAYNGFNDSGRRELALHLKEWIKILNEIRKEVIH